MALTINIEGVGVIANASSATESISTGTNGWNEDGAGTDSWTTDTYLQGGECFAGAYSAKSGYQYYHTSMPYDFTASGNAEGQFIYIWVNCPTIGLMQTLANKGLAIRVGTDLSNYREWTIAGSDDSNGWLGDWKCFVIDPTMAGTSGTGAGTFDVSDVNYVGVWVDASAIAKGDNIFIDQIAIGSGLRITGSSTQAWQDVIDYCTDYTNRAWGMLTQKEGVAFAQGAFFIGDTAQSALTDLADAGQIIQFQKSQYWNGSAWVSTYPADACGIFIEDNASFATTYTDGVLVGSDNGRSGSTIIGTTDQAVSLDLHGGSNAASATKLYGTNLKRLAGALTLGASANHKMFGCAVVGCAQLDPVGAPTIRNTTFAETADVDGALLWNESIDIQSSAFIANSLGAAIEMPSAAGTPYDFTSLTFSGNTYDVLNSSGSAITVNLSDSNASSAEGSSVTFNNTVALTIEAPVSLVGAEIRIYDLDNSPAGSLGTELAGVESHTAATYVYSGNGGNLIYIQIMLDGYVEFGQSYTMPASATTFTALLQADLNS